ncbi:DUF1800 family protein [Jejudonia soesokkakensis]|uniref:DUF1800 family protein n=1 Tax=Jejudonia soesokkakensis TaxID=1323432 RepID=A0ABW2MWE9_9FLAO
MEIVTTPSCNASTLTPYIPSGGNPWTLQKVKHTYRRLAFGGSIDEMDAALAQTPDQFIDFLVDTAANLTPTPAPSWGYFSINDFTNFDVQNNENRDAWALQTANDFISEKMRGRLTFFWMNHFVTEYESYGYSPYMFQYYNAIQIHAFGNFKDFVHAIGINNTMLVYLNGFENTNVNPNENYARELFELFTLGEDNNYTQSDIINASRALTGYNHWDEPGAQIYFDAITFDAGEKTIFGQTGAWGYDELIDILFEQRAPEIANHICGKLYQYFVSPAIDDFVQTNIISQLAQTFIDEEWDLIPVLKQLFKSEHFYDEKALGVIIKSPYDVINTYINEASFLYNDEILEGIIYFAGLIGQTIFDPPDVSGWQRDETWINGSTLTGRWQLLEFYNYYLFENGENFTFADFAREVSNDSNDPAYITQTIIEHFTSKELHTASDYTVATDIFKWEVPQNYYDNGTWSLSWDSAPYQVILLLNHLARIPEFQLK